MRGKHGVGVGDAGAAGLIPARAGKTRHGGRRGRRRGAHPRACGENSGSHVRGSLTGGSSPRVRGKPQRATLRIHRTGLIPARAGKTRPRRGARRPGRAHPRACGENEWVDVLGFEKSGSSPRVRGKLVHDRHDRAGARLIPARAGKTAAVSVSRANCPAHPRACGENSRIASPTRPRVGSSPRVRGKPRLHRRTPVSFRLIPARAGKTVIADGETGDP